MYWYWGLRRKRYCLPDLLLKTTRHITASCLSRAFLPALVRRHGWLQACRPLYRSHHPHLLICKWAASNESICMTDSPRLNCILYATSAWAWLLRQMGTARFTSHCPGEYAAEPESQMLFYQRKVSDNRWHFSLTINVKLL